MNKQSSIEWLVEQLIPNAMRMFDATTCNAIEQAKQMHKNEIEDAYNEALYDHRQEDGEQYYNKTFKQHARK